MPVCALALLAFAWTACSGGSSNSTSGTPRGGATVPGTAANLGGSSGQSQTKAAIKIGTASAPLGAQASVDLQALGLSDPGLGAWTLEVAYDAQIVSVVQCSTPPNALSACNPKASAGRLRLAGATATGLKGDVTLGTITFKCEAAGTSTLDVTAETLVDGTIGDPRDIERTVENGAIRCGP